MIRKRHIVAAFIGIVAVLGLALVAYHLVVPGLSVATQEPPALEVKIATWLLHQSVPEDARKAVNPLGKDVADMDLTVVVGSRPQLHQPRLDQFRDANCAVEERILRVEVEMYEGVRHGVGRSE